MKQVLWILSLVILLPSNVEANLNPSDLARQSAASQVAKSTNPNTLPGYKGDNPPEAGFASNPQGLEGAKEGVFYRNEAASFLQDSSHKRPFFAIDPEKDPIIANSKEALLDPAKLLESASYKQRIGSQYITKNCEESRKPEERKCISYLNIVSKNLARKEYFRTHYWGWNGNYYNGYEYDTPHVTEYRTHSFDGINHSDANVKHEYNYFVRQFLGNVSSRTGSGEWQKADEATFKKYSEEDNPQDSWIDQCSSLRNQYGLDGCKLVSTVCLEGPETRDFGDVSITRSCWKREHTYACQYPSKKDCDSLRFQGCEQLQSHCKRSEGGKCVVWNQNFRCPTKVEWAERKLPGGLSKINIPSSEANTAYAPNNEFGHAMSTLSALSAIQKEISSESYSGRSTIDGVFKGKVNQCTTTCGRFKECCHKGGGWGVDLGLSNCDAEDKQTAELRGRNLCVEVGTFCAEKVLGVCIRKKKSYCCFPSKLSRLIHEQGRSQLHIGWGDGEHPQCRGFTVEELSQLNFSFFNFSEVYADIQASVKEKVGGVVQRNVTDRVKHMSHRFKNEFQVEKAPFNKPTKGGM